MQWVIVDDGSVDNTGAIINGMRRYPWITVLHRATL